MEDAPEPEVCERNSAEGPCGDGVSGHRTLLTHFLRGERDRSETKIRTVAARLAGEGPRWPGDGAAGVGGAGWIDRERHQYRSAAWPRTSVPVISSEGPLSLIPMRALLTFPSARGGAGRDQRGARGAFGLVVAQRQGERRVSKPSRSRGSRTRHIVTSRQRRVLVCRLGEAVLVLVPVRADWSRPLVNTSRRFLWRSAGSLVDDCRANLWTTLGNSGVRRSSCPGTPCGTGVRGRRTSPTRTPSGESGIGRRRRSAPPAAGLPEEVAVAG